ncbi:sushi domain-containing protein 5 [Echeneis naucrates]|uniref:sushi domain-containing protein 5 n=1 Tax=Echeneis naucrates TaxID=173247 RepID=UPI001113EBFC|nr:sushi domain-containing protein 5 [Echeneis naucrates]
MMLDLWKHTALSLVCGWLACMVMTSAVNADGRVFVLDLMNSSSLQGFRDAERACASQHARLASAEELRHAVVECFFSLCTRGWLYGGTVGATVCNNGGSTLRAVDVRTENATEDAAHLDAFCIKDKGVPCGDPPSFPNARLQGHSGFEMGDELLYSCVPGYVMPSGHNAFSLLCDSCGEWYGLVQICVKDETESHIDYEDKFTDSYGEEDLHTERPQEANGEVSEEVHGAAYAESKSQEQQETSFGAELEEEHHDKDREGGQKIIGQKIEEEQELAIEDFTGHPKQEQDRIEVVRADTAAATEASVSLLSQKHMFWFPSEAFQEEGHPVSTNPASQTTQRASGAQSEESREKESQERHSLQHPVDADERESYSVHDIDDHNDHNDSHQDVHEDSRHHEQDDLDSHQDPDEHDDHMKYIPAQHGDLDRWERHEKPDDDHSDHYDMGEHEDDRVRYGSQAYDGRDDAYDEQESYEDPEDVTDDQDDRQHSEVSKEHPERDDQDDGEDHYDTGEDGNDRSIEHDDHESHEDEDDHHRVTFSTATNDQKNITQKGTGGKSTTDETWLDGYPVVPGEAEKGDSTTERERPEETERGTLARTTDRPNEVELRRPVPYTSSPEEGDPLTAKPEQEGAEETWPGFIPTAAPSPDQSQPSDSPSYADTLDYDTQQAAPTHSWQGDLTKHPSLNHGPAPPVHDDGTLSGVMEEHTVHNLPGETGERAEVEGEMGETICTGDNCPPHPPSSSSRGPTVAAIIVALCVVAVAVVIGVWCYRRQQQKSSVYKMNGKGQSQTRQGQQIEMQQKV